MNIVDKEPLIIPLIRWLKIQSALRQDAANVRESGAFLLGRNRTITDYVLYKDLDPEVNKDGIIIFHGKYYTKLWDFCLQNKISVLADIHCHPGKNIELSEADRKHPMIPNRGHIAIILPYFANKLSLSLSKAAIYTYQGEHEWLKSNQARIKLW